MSGWTHRCCETCWTGKKGLDELGRIRTPTQFTEAHNAPCCYCGDLVIVSGIFVRDDPTTLICGGQHEPPWRWSNIAPMYYSDRQND